MPPGHFYGGSIVAHPATANDSVVWLVFVSAFQPDSRESTDDLNRGHVSLTATGTARKVVPVVCVSNASRRYGHPDTAQAASASSTTLARGVAPPAAAQSSVTV